MILISKKDNSTKVEVIKYDDKSFTYQVRFLNGEKKGKTTVYSSGTVKRWWKRIKEDNNLKAESAKQKIGGKTVERESIIQELSSLLSIKFVEYPSTPGLYRPDTKPAEFHIGITKSHVSVYNKNSKAIKIKYTDDYISKVAELLQK